VVANRGALLLTMIIWTAVPPGARALEAAKVVSLSECLQAASARSPQAVQGILGEQRARAAHDEALAQRLPHLNIVGTLDVSDDPATQLPDSNKAVVRLEQSIHPFTPAWVRGNQTGSLLKAAEFTKIESRQDIGLVVKQLYFAIQRDQATIESNQRIERELARLKDTVLPKYTVGRVPPFDLIKVKTSLSDLARSREQVQAQLGGEKELLALIIGLPSGSMLEIKPLGSLPELGIPSQLRDLSSNPTLLSLSEQVHASELGAQGARFARFPSLVTGVEYGYSGQTTSTATPGWDVTMALSLSLWDWGQISAQVRQAQADTALAESRLDLQRQQLSADFITTRATAEAQRADEKRMIGLLSQVQRSAQVSITRYRQGAATIIETSDAVNLWLQTLLNEQNARYGYLSSIAKLERLTGKDSVRYE
jgi:outer membrane protein